MDFSVNDAKEEQDWDNFDLAIQKSSLHKKEEIVFAATESLLRALLHMRQAVSEKGTFERCHRTCSEFDL